MSHGFILKAFAGAISALLCLSPIMASAKPPTVLTPWTPEIAPDAGVYDRQIASFRLVEKAGRQLSGVRAHTQMNRFVSQASYDEAYYYSDLTTVSFGNSFPDDAVNDCIPGGYLKIPEDTTLSSSCQAPQQIVAGDSESEFTFVSLK